MVLMKAQEKQQLDAMRQQCGQERDLQVKQVENGYVIQSVVRFFMDQGNGPVNVGEMSDTTVAVTATECAVIASNFLKYGEFWPDDAEPFADETVEPDFVGGTDPVAEALMPEVVDQNYKDSMRRDHIMPEVAARKPFYTGDVPPALPIAGENLQDLDK